MALPHTPTYVSPFDVITSQAENETQDNIVALSNGTGLEDTAVPFAKIDFTTFGTVDANGWKDYGIFYLKSYIHTNNTSIAAHSGIYVSTQPSAPNGSGPVAEGGNFPSDRTTTKVVGELDGTQPALVITQQGTFSRGFFAFNSTTSAASWGTRTIIMTIYKA